MTFEYGYIGLFLASFLAATLLPVASELILTGMLALGFDPTVVNVMPSVEI